MAQLYAVFDSRTRQILAVCGEERMRAIINLKGVAYEHDALKLPVGVSVRAGGSIDNIPYKTRRTEPASPDGP